MNEREVAFARLSEQQIHALRPWGKDYESVSSEVLIAEGDVSYSFFVVLTGSVLGRGGEDIWLTFDDEGPLAIVYIAPERMTSGTSNLYLMAVHPARHARAHSTG